MKLTFVEYLGIQPVPVAKVPVFTEIVQERETQ